MKKIKEWEIHKAQEVDKEITIKVSSKVKSIHPVVDKIVGNLAQIDIIQFIRISPDFLQASNETTVGRVKTPITKPDHPTAVGVSLMLFFDYRQVQFYEMNSPIKGYGGKMVDAVMNALPEGWEALILMDWSGGFWEKMRKKYNNIVIV